jgi:hypothetical protein
MINGITKNMIEPMAKLPRNGKPKQWGDKLEAIAVFQPDVPRLHVNEDTRVVTINGESKGMVRRIGKGVFLWSTPIDEGREATEEEAFLRLGFRYYIDRTGERSLIAANAKVAK